MFKKVMCVIITAALLFMPCINRTYLTAGTVTDIKGNEIYFEDASGEVFSCWARETDSVKPGDVYILKFNGNRLTNRETHKLIDFGKTEIYGFILD